MIKIFSENRPMADPEHESGREIGIIEKTLALPDYDTRLFEPTLIRKSEFKSSAFDKYTHSSVLINSLPLNSFLAFFELDTDTQRPYK